MAKSYVLTANHTLNGGTLYWHRNGHWQSDLYSAQIFEKKPDAEALLEEARGMEAWVCDPHLERISHSSGTIQTLGTRQWIRTKGEGVLLRLGYGENG